MKTRNLRNFRFASIIASMWLAATLLAVAQSSGSLVVPHLIKFSGMVKNDAGQPKTGVVGITFALYKDQEGGAALWLETQNVQADANGRYTVMLGSTKSDGLPVDLFTSNEARWVGVQPQGQAEQARVLLVSAPYALKAADAETLGGKPASAFLLAKPGNAGAPTSNVVTPEAISNAQPIVHGSGKANFIPIWKSKTTLADSVLFQTGGNVGIGTTTPSTPLDVKGNATIEGTESVTGAVGIGSAPGTFQLQVTAPAQLGALIQGPFAGVGTGLDLQTTGTGGKGWEILATGKTAAQGAGRLNIRDLSTSIDVLTIAPNGLVGIGTVNPGIPLDVESSKGLTAILGNQPASSGGFGVIGQTASSTLNMAGVWGNAIAPTGLTFGVFGQTSSSGNGAAGVMGQATATSGGQTFGVYGLNPNSATFSAGVAADSDAVSGTTFGLLAVDNSPNGAGMYSDAIMESSTALSLIGCCPVGAWGDAGSSLGGAAGLVGTADDARAIFLQNNSPSGVPTAFVFNAENTTHNLPVFNEGGQFGFCAGDTDGNLGCTGNITAHAPVAEGKRQVALYAMESPQNWFEDFGEGQIIGGTAKVTLDTTFADAANTDVRYHVFLTPRGECEGLYVSDATASGFEVHELHGGRSNVGFDYRVVALRRGYENVRLEDMTERWKNITAPLPKGTPGERIKLPVPSSHALVARSLGTLAASAKK